MKTPTRGKVMSDYVEQMDDVDVICPYCNERYQPEAADYSEDERVEECESCGKKYHHWDTFSITHETQPDCELNGEAHKFGEILQGDYISHTFCTICGHLKRIA